MPRCRRAADHQEDAARTGVPASAALVRRVIGLLVLVVVLALVVSVLPGLQDVRERFHRAEPTWLAATFACVFASTLSYIAAVRGTVTTARLARELEPRDGGAGQQRPGADRRHRRARARRGGDAARGRPVRGRHAALGRAVPAHERGELRRDRGRRDHRGARRVGRRDGVGRHVAARRAGAHRDGGGRRARAPPGR